MTLSLDGLHAESRKPENARPKWPDWTGTTVVCVATGPSLSIEDLDRLHNYRTHGAMTVNVIAVNEAGLRQYLPLAAPWADILYAADRLWWDYYKPAFLGLMVSADKPTNVETLQLGMLCHASGNRMPREPGRVISGSHSGFQALGLALSLGAARVILLGYDCGKIGGERHALNLARPLEMEKDSPYAQWAKVYDIVPKQWPGVEILNGSELSAITAFPKVQLGNLL